MRILFACGGTAGHINPALAIASTIRAHHPEAQIAFAGNPEGMEQKLVTEAGWPFYPIRIQGFQRQLSWFNIRYDTKSLVYFFTSKIRAKAILKEFAPDIAIGTGGYACYPILHAAAKAGIPSFTHEQNAFPGVATKMVMKNVDKVLLAVEEAKRYLPEGRPYAVVGNPIRPEILTADRKTAREEMGIGDRFCLLTFGGSLGAQTINRCVADVMAWHQDLGTVHHIHATGRFGVDLFDDLMKEKGIDPAKEQIDVREYISDMPRCLAAADLVICRAGAITLSELQAMGKAAILIPSPNVANNHQYYNAMVLAEHDAAVVIEEKDVSSERLIGEIRRLMEDPAARKSLEEHAKAMAITDANERIYREIAPAIETVLRKEIHA